MVLIVTKKQIYKKNALKRSFYMFACERCARKICTCYTEDTKMVHTQHSSHLNSRWRLVIHAATHGAPLVRFAPDSSAKN